MGKLDGKVALITGAARAQGRSHAIRLAEEGCGIVAIDICEQISSVPYAMATRGELDEMATAVRATGQRVHAVQADVRDADALQSAVAQGIDAVGPLDIVIANAGIMSLSSDEHPRSWQDVIDVNLTGVFNTVEACLPAMIERGAGGSIVLVSSTAGLRGIGPLTRGMLAYTAAKHGVVGLMRLYANGAAKHSIRVNTIHPTGVASPMVVNDTMAATVAAFPDAFTGNPMPVGRLEPTEISHAIAWLVSDDARYVTGVALPVDAGFVNKV